MKREFCSKSVFKYHLLNWKCHYFYYECMGLKKTTLSLLKGVTFGLVCVWVKSNWLNVTKYEVFIFWRRPLLKFWQGRVNPNSQLDTYHRSGLWQGSRPVQNIKWPGRKWKCPNAGLWTHSSEFTQGNPIAVYVFVYFLISKWSPVARSLLSGLTPYSPHLLPPTGIKL